MIAEIDCESYKSLCQKFKVREYPTIIMFRNGFKFEKYVGERTKPDFVSYVQDVLGEVKDET